MKKIDIHCHTTNRPLKIGNADLGTISRKMEENEIEKTILMATYFPHRGSGISNFRLHDWIRGKKEFWMFGSLDFENYFNQGYNELEELAEKGAIKGIKIYTCYQNIDLKGNKIDKVLRLAEKFELPVAFHCGYSYQTMREYKRHSIAEMVKASDLEFLARKYKTNFIFSHLSKPFLDDLIGVVKRNDNVYTDMSGLIDSKTEFSELDECIGNVKKFVNKCGSERLLFGTDFPVQTHEHSIAMIDNAIKNKKDKENIYYNNAKKLLKLNQTGG
jgi:hypothetical protein